jgi:hypothetical protein
MLLVAAHLAAAPVAPATVPPEQPVARVTTAQRAPAMRLERVSAPERSSRATGTAQAPAAESNRSLLVIILLAVAIGALLVVAF